MSRQAKSRLGPEVIAPMLLPTTPKEAAQMVQCPGCGYLIPEAWTTCKRCDTTASVRTDAADPFAYNSPVRWSPADEAVTVKVTTSLTEDWWRRPAEISLVATAAGFVLVLAATFALPWMHVGGGIFHLGLSYKQMQDFLSARDFFSRAALDLGPLILLGDLILVGWSLAARGRIGIEAASAPIGLACLDLYVTAEIHGFVGNVNGDAGATALGFHAGTGWGPWVCLLGCACLVVGALTGWRSTTTAPRATTSQTGHF